MRRKSTSTQPSLFPFLAVLVSTMGALIFLLLVISRQAQMQRAQQLAQMEAANEEMELPPLELPPLPSLPELEEYPSVEPLEPFALQPLPERELPPIPELVDPRQRLLEEHDKQRRELEELEKQLKRPLTEQEQLASVERSLQTIRIGLAKAVQDRQIRTAALEEVDLELKRLENELLRRRRQAGQVSNKFSIVPYEGNNGTSRRPIYLECRADRIVLQPEGVAVTADQIRDPQYAGNALALMVEAIVHDLRKDADQAKPYPLLIVRPDGIASFYVAWAAFDALELDFGYELVDKEIELDYPQAEARIREIAVQILEESTGYALVWSDAYGWQANGRRGLMAGSPGPPGMGVGSNTEPSGSERFADLFSGTGSGGPREPGFPSSAQGDTQNAAAIGMGNAGGAMGDSAQTSEGSGTPGSVPSGQPGTAGTPAASLAADRVILPGDTTMGESASSGTPAGAAAGQKGLASTPVTGNGSLSTSNEKNLSGLPGTNSGSSDGKPGMEPSAGDPGSADVVDAEQSSKNKILTMLGQAGAEPSPFDSKNNNQKMLPPGSQESMGLTFDTAKQEPVGVEASSAGTIRYLPRTVKRYVDIDCQSTGIRLFPQEEQIPVYSDEQAYEVARVILNHAVHMKHQWGDAGPRSRWQPVLRFHVRPDGLENYYRLRLALLPSGVQVERQFVDWTDLIHASQLQGELW